MDELLLLSKAMADENRLKIVALIQREKELCVCEICDTLELSQPLVSRHLKQLKSAKVLDSHKEGKWMMYRIAALPSDILAAYLRHLEKESEGLGVVCSCSMRGTRDADTHK